MKCETCENWKVLNPHHIKDGRPVKSCTYGESPEYCGYYKKVGTKQQVNTVKRIVLIFKGPKRKRFSDHVTDGLKVFLFVFFPFAFRLIDCDGYEADPL